jgi:predicted nucleic acid-binding protein
LNQQWRYVVDASVTVKWVLPETDTERARLLRQRSLELRFELVAPDVVVGESVNAIWKRCRLRREIDEDEARSALEQLMRLLPRTVPAAPLASQALELALAFRRPVYDCLYVALAMREGIMLVTADGPLVAALGRATGRIVHLSDLDLPA